jgi:cytochrome oxidase Cu insertion factor (SCO1/SenC/PrrC family)
MKLPIIGTAAVVGGALGIGLCAARIVVGQAPATASVATVDVTKLGPQVGDRVPDFTLADQHGQTRTLSSLMGAKGLVLAFTRSADW